MTTTTGIIERVYVETNDRGFYIMTILLEGAPAIIKGEVQSAIAPFGHTMSPEVLLAKPGDEVSFRYERDFNDYIRSFVNHTLANRLIG